MAGTLSTDSAALHSAITADGYGFVQGNAMREMLARFGSLGDWPAFADSWNRLGLDHYMADGGRYRHRRHATFVVAQPQAPIERAPHQPHYQPLDYNPLNGGIERWFDPLEPAADGDSLRTILAACRALFDGLAPLEGRWHIEVHQFRIEARRDEQGKPTPEGLHRDGVNYVLVLLVDRENIAQGMTTIHALDGRELGHFTLTHPFDAALVDDARVAHGVTPVEPIDARRPAHRDVLVVTFRALQAAP